MTPGLKGITRVDELELKGKRVFCRVDFNVPMENGKITDDKRIQAALPTIRFLLEKGARVVLASHFGRPEKGGDRKQYSLEPVATRLRELLGGEVILVDSPTNEAPKALLTGIGSDQVLLLENLRFAEGETKNATDFAAHLASYTDVYVNDAFGASHRAHASIDALPRLISQKGIGFLISKEIEFLDALLHAPVSPYIAVLGGAKVSDKIAVIENMIEKIDTFIVGGAMAYTFLAAKGVPVGSSRVEKDRLKFAEEMMGRIDARKKKILLPIDHLIVEKFENNEFRTTQSEAIPEGWMGLDIGPKTIQLYRNELAKAKTVFWNGPMGVFERAPFSKGTFAIAEAMASLTDAKTVVGGGDSAAAAELSGYANKMSHISTGGGASLEYLQGDKLPGLEVLRAPRVK